jgi:hypothetical protein
MKSQHHPLYADLCWGGRNRDYVACPAALSCHRARSVATTAELFPHDNMQDVGVLACSYSDQKQAPAAGI